MIIYVDDLIAELKKYEGCFCCIGNTDSNTYEANTKDRNILGIKYRNDGTVVIGADEFTSNGYLKYTRQ